MMKMIETGIKVDNKDLKLRPVDLKWNDLAVRYLPWGRCERHLAWIAPHNRRVRDGPGYS